MNAYMMHLMAALSEAGGRIWRLADDLLGAPADLTGLWHHLTRLVDSDVGVRGFTYMLILLVIGVGLEWLFWTYALPSRQAIEAAEPETPRRALVLGLQRLGLRFAGLLLFVGSIVAATSGFVWPPGIQDVVVTLTLAILTVRFAGLVSDFFLAPRTPRLRLLRMTPQAAKRASKGVAAVVYVLAAGIFLAELVDHAGAVHLASIIRVAAAVLTAVLLLGAIAAQSRARPRVPRRGRRLPASPLAFMGSCFVLGVLALWLIGADRAAASLIVAAVVVGAEVVLRDMVEALTRSDEEASEDDTVAAVVSGIVLRLMRLLVALVGLGIGAVIWGVPILAMEGGDSMGGRLAGRILGAIALLLITDVIWAAAKAAIDTKLSRLGPMALEGRAGPNARLGTLLPLLRKGFGITLWTLALLSTLSILGIEITPLLAGAGVIGIALGFGAQTLVRDILSGMFFLIEDVFRVGEYIESGTNIKGTVERITLRSVALRHHNGPLYFVPYGSMGAVRNNSRDWVIEKFNIPLPHTVDIETVRKLVKKVGQKMLEEPELAAVINEPLKCNIYRIEPGLKIFRCKFQSLPGQQFTVRAQAYRRIETALKAAGLGFADNAQKLLVEHQGTNESAPETISTLAGVPPSMLNPGAAAT